MTVAEAIPEAVRILTEAEIDTPRLDAQLLLAWVLKVRREDLAREPERMMTEREQIIFAKSVSLRAQRRPLPYITGEQFFYGRPFKINRAVLIPRPETELLVEAALGVVNLSSANTIADIGTGSGCLAVTLALEVPQACVWATDISSEALTLARKNVVRYQISDRVNSVQGDLLSPLPPDVKFDLIVSNPPYITEAEYPELQPEVRDYEPPLALTGLPGASGTDGTLLHRRLLDEAPRFLNPGGGWVLLEVGQGQGQIVADYASARGYRDVSIRNDFANIPRIVLAHWV